MCEDTHRSVSTRRVLRVVDLLVVLRDVVEDCDAVDSVEVVPVVDDVFEVLLRLLLATYSHPTNDGVKERLNK